MYQKSRWYDLVSEKNEKKSLEILSFYMCTKNHIWFLKYKAGQNVLSFWAIFVLLPTWRPRKPKFWKIKKIPGGIIILLMCTINDKHMMYGSWDMESDRIFYFEPFFALLPPYGPRKSKFWNKKNTYRYYRFTQLYHKWQSYYVWLLRYGAGRT